MRRREFVKFAGGAVVAWPRGACSQQTAKPVIGFLHGGSATEFTQQVTGFREGLQQAGYVEGQNVGIEYRWAEGRFDALPALADELVRRHVAVIGGDAVATAVEVVTDRSNYKM